MNVCSEQALNKNWFSVPNPVFVNMRDFVCVGVPTCILYQINDLISLCSLSIQWWYSSRRAPAERSQMAGYAEQLGQVDGQKTQEGWTLKNRLVFVHRFNFVLD